MFYLGDTVFITCNESQSNHMPAKKNILTFYRNTFKDIETWQNSSMDAFSACFDLTMTLQIPYLFLRARTTYMFLHSQEFAKLTKKKHLHKLIVITESGAYCFCIHGNLQS